MTFIPISGDYVVASRDFLGGPDTAMIGNVVEANFLRIQDYPTASAISVMLMATIVVLVSAYVRRSGTDEPTMTRFSLGKYLLPTYVFLTFLFLMVSNWIHLRVFL